MEASWKCEGALAVKSLKTTARLGKRPHNNSRGQAEGVGGTRVSQGVEDTRTGQIYPPKLLSTVRGYRTGLGKSGPNQT